MAGWISSKLKAAETILQQIDQQAAESLGKNEQPQSPYGTTSDKVPKKIDSAIPLKYQLPKKSPPPPTTPPDISRQSQRYSLELNVHRHQGKPDAAVRPSSSTNPDPAIIDWTELLSSPKPISPVPSLDGRNKKKNKKPVIPAAPALDKETQGTPLSGSILSPPQGSEKVGAKNLSRNNEEEELPLLSSAVASSSSSPGLSQGHSQSHSPSGIFHEKENNDLHLLVDKAAADGSCGVGEYRSAIASSDLLHHDDSSGCSSRSDDGSNSGTEDSASASDLEDERQKREERRKRRARVIAEKVAAAAIKAIKEREDIVARLEGEKQSLEKMLEEREKQQAQEASELQMSMMETMEAVELEKQKHNSTRMEALACLAKLETTNAELARSLVTVQWNLEVEVNRVSELRQKIELKELAQEEHKRKMSKIHQRSSSPSKEESLRKAELEQEILDAEYSFICNKIGQLKEKAKKIEDDIESTRRERVHPTDVEVELRKRLAQLTDHLIQKQTQVEALSSKKATLVLRIEMVSRLLDENGLSLQATDVSDDSGKGLAAGSVTAMFDIEAGTWQEPSNSALHERIRSGRQQLGSLLYQLDAIFSAGAIFLRRNATAQLWSLLYLLCLHIWVMYILMSSHSGMSDDGSVHGAVFSLEIINKTSGS